MNVRKTLLTLIGVTSVSLSLVAVAVEQNADHHELIRLSEDGAKAASTISLARVAIFEGQPQEAKKLMDQAKTALDAAAKNVDEPAIKTSEHRDLGPMVPFDARLSVADVYSLTPDKQDEIAKVNEHLKKGETKKALEVLRPIDVRLTLTSRFMPLNSTTEAVDQAEKLLADNKYYEANLALKKAEDSWVIDSQSFVDYLEKLPNSSKQVADATSPDQSQAVAKPSKTETAPTGK